MDPVLILTLGAESRLIINSYVLCSSGTESDVREGGPGDGAIASCRY